MNILLLNNSWKSSMMSATTQLYLTLSDLERSKSLIFSAYILKGAELGQVSLLNMSNKTYLI